MPSMTSIVWLKVGEMYMAVKLLFIPGLNLLVVGGGTGAPCCCIRHINPHIKDFRNPLSYRLIQVGALVLLDNKYVDMSNKQENARQSANRLYM